MFRESLKDKLTCTRIQHMWHWKPKEYSEGQKGLHSRVMSDAELREIFRGASNPHSKVICGTEDRESTSRDKQPTLESNIWCWRPREHFEGQTAHSRKQYAALKIERALRGTNSLHLKAICSAKDRKGTSRDKQPALESNTRCWRPRERYFKYYNNMLKAVVEVIPQVKGSVRATRGGVNRR
jgi:hypothetical protein